jgi:LysM repeat protein
VTAIVLGAGIFVFPHLARAFWPFSLLSNTAQAGESSVMPDGSLVLLAAATNSDPNPDKRPRGIETTEGSAIIADAGPEGTPPDTAVAGSNGAISLYVVRPGDTLSEIAGHVRCHRKHYPVGK